MVNTVSASASAFIAPDPLPTPILARIIAHSDPRKWHALGNASVRAIISLTSFRCEWVYNLACAANVPARPKTTDDIIHTATVVLDPVTKLVGSDDWMSENLIRALKCHRPSLFTALAPCLVWTFLLHERRDLASMVVTHSRLDLCMLDGRFVRALVENRPLVWMLEWLEHNGLDIHDLYQQDKCFNMSILTSWVMSSRVDLLDYLAQRHISLPARSLLEYALSHSTPQTVDFLVVHGASNRNRISWNDLLMMACTDAKTRLDVFQHIIANTEPSIVWTFAACCLASHAMLDDSAYTKFSALRGTPNAEHWLTRSLRGRTPIECLCERLTYENMPFMSPFIRDYLELGVSSAGMPNIVAALCQ
ncbi:hypothetical protein LPJ59_004018 [Coemansia sp. RSA 2399]|nr:hypothetical protein LPJ59_004018 [Coemansia sp. RSA 2399]KAJ1904382.1 hypothetical protein LPJ81_002526 [Coemansia sp. IMI 209127]